MQTKILLALCLVAISQVNAHGAITAVQGSNGMTGEAFGVDQSTPVMLMLPVMERLSHL
uniref:N-glycosylation site corresponding to basepairs n=1 Tax=Phakopsora pachyrhizi TaxID=170000 RepID=A0A0S1MKA0_PHAPC